MYASTSWPVASIFEPNSCDVPRMALSNSNVVSWRTIGGINFFFLIMTIKIYIIIANIFGLKFTKKPQVGIASQAP